MHVCQQYLNVLLLLEKLEVTFTSTLACFFWLNSLFDQPFLQDIAASFQTFSPIPEDDMSLQFLPLSFSYVSCSSANILFLLTFHPSPSLSLKWTLHFKKSVCIASLNDGGALELKNSWGTICLSFLLWGYSRNSSPRERPIPNSVHTPCYPWEGQITKGQRQSRTTYTNF